MSSEHGDTVDGDDKAVAGEANLDASEAKPAKDQLSESGQLTDSVFDWIKIANHAYDSDDLENAKQCYLRALELFEEDNTDQMLRLLCLNRLGDICLRLKQPEAAFKIFSRAKSHRQTESRQKLALNIAIAILAALSWFSLDFPTASITASGTLPNHTVSAGPAMGVAHAALSDKRSVSPIRPDAEFKTADQLSTIKIANSDTLYRWDRGEVWGARYVTPNFSFGDVLKLISGCRKKREQFLITRSDSLIDDAGLIFYGPDAPEVKLVERMWWYSSFINYYFEEFKKYPTTEETWMNTEVGYSYTNPFTGKTEKPGFVAALRRTDNPPAELRPGAVLILSTPDGICTICGYDRNGKLVTSSNPGKPLLLQLRKGVNVTDQYLKSFGGMNKVRKSGAPETFVLIDDPSMKAFFKGAETYVPSIALPLLLASLTLSLFLFRVFLKSPGRLLSFSPMLVPSFFVLILLLMSYGE